MHWGYNHNIRKCGLLIENQGGVVKENETKKITFQCVIVYWAAWRR